MALWEGGGRGSRGMWVKHYASFHRILLVGEGDFSFALCLAVSFGSASNIVATSFDSRDVVIKKYERGYWNLQQLDMFGATLIHEVDATKMKDSATDLANWRFDRIVYNFPHAGFHGKEDSPELIKMHQDLVEGFFYNAAEMLQPHGEVHVSHKTSAPFCHWNIAGLAFRNSLRLLERVSFNIEDYPGYINKRGDGAKPDDFFPLGECCTYKFGHNYNQPRSDISKLGWLIFNISGVSMGELGRAGCGGVMTDEDRNVLFLFRAPLGILEHEVVELCAFKAALCRLLRLRLFGKVLIRSTSYVAISWVNNPSTRPMHLLKCFTDIDAMLNVASGVRIQLVGREENCRARSLAKEAILTGEPFEAEL